MPNFFRRAAALNQRGSHLCAKTWGTGCGLHAGGQHRCTYAKKHHGEHQCECSAALPR